MGGCIIPLTHSGGKRLLKFGGGKYVTMTYVIICLEKDCNPME